MNVNRRLCLGEPQTVLTGEIERERVDVYLDGARGRTRQVLARGASCQQMPTNPFNSLTLIWLNVYLNNVG